MTAASALATGSSPATRGAVLRACAAQTIGLVLAGTFGWFGVCSVELRELALGWSFGWIAVIHLLRVSWWFACVGSAAVLVLHGLRRGLQAFSKHAELGTSLLLAAACTAPAWDIADALLGGGMFGNDEDHAGLRALLLAALLSVYALAWLHHVASCGAPGFSWPTALQRPLSRVPDWARALTSWLLGAGALVAFVETIDHGLRAYLFVARYLVPAEWLLVTSLVFSLGARLPRLVRRSVCGLGVVLVAAAFIILPPERGLRRVQHDLARLAGAASLSDVSAQKQLGAKLAALDFSRPDGFDCETQSKPLTAAPRDETHRNVILISVDALRKDTVAGSNDGKPTMPAVAGFARSGLSFERAVTTYPATLFALGSALTGLGPSEVLFAPDAPRNVFTLAKQVIPEQHAFLPEARWFRKPNIRKLITQSTPTAFGVDGAQSTDRMLDVLQSARQRNERVFAWIHYYEPHVIEPKPRDRKLGYAQEARYVDDQIARVLRSLEALHYFDDSLVIFFADHGEALGELGFLGHHVYLNHFLTDIPLVVRVPHIKPARDSRAATIADIAPTILQWLGLPIPRSDARSLLEPLKGGDARYVVSEAFPLRGSALFTLARKRITSVAALRRRVNTVLKSAVDYSPKVAITTAHHRLIVDRDSGAEELYDRDRDPEEKHNLADDGLTVHEQLKRELATWAVRQSESIYCAVAKPL